MSDELLNIVRRYGLEELDEPLILHSGESSSYFIDAKRALAEGAHLALACGLLVNRLAVEHIDFDVIGGPTLGADHLAHGVAVVANKRWFTVRKERKGRGTNKRIEGAVLARGDRVILVDDVVNTGDSIVDAYYTLLAETNVKIVAAMSLVDRGGIAAEYFEFAEVPYFPLLTGEQLGIPTERDTKGLNH